MDSIFNFFYGTGFTGLMGFFFAGGELPLVRRPFYLNNPKILSDILFFLLEPFLANTHPKSSPGTRMQP
jgi:hypothetical protein